MLHNLLIPPFNLEKSGLNALVQPEKSQSITFLIQAISLLLDA